MNGRVYASGIGRMLSPDPVTQAPENGQNYNRYSYTFNNPLRFNDPNGLVAVKINQDGLKELLLLNLSGGTEGTTAKYLQVQQLSLALKAGDVETFAGEPLVIRADINLVIEPQFSPGQGNKGIRECTTNCDSVKTIKVGAGVIMVMVTPVSGGIGLLGAGLLYKTIGPTGNSPEHDATVYIMEDAIGGERAENLADGVDAVSSAFGVRSGYDVLNTAGSTIGRLRNFLDFVLTILGFADTETSVDKSNPQ